ncbi:MAG: type II secretion system F family protein, partial [Proteobacteria bacterium]|nr:type II secretion system F family protein [Pseudomonadota bacterium]
MDAYVYLLWILGFLAAVLFLEGLYVLWNGSHGSEARRIRARLEAAVARSAIAGTIVKSRKLAKQPAVDRFLRGIPGVDSLDLVLEQAGSRLSVSVFFAITLGVAVGGLLLGMCLDMPTLILIGVALAGALLPLICVSHSRKRRLGRIEEQLPDLLELLARAMRAGHAFPSALQMAAEEMPEPCAGEVRIVFDEINFGIPVPTALMNLAERVPTTDLRYFAVAVSIQRETGGNLAELLNSIATLIRARFRFLRAVRTLTAEGRLSAWILVLLPFALAGVITVVNPEFIRVLWTDPMGIKMVWSAALLMCLGIFWMT